MKNWKKKLLEYLKVLKFIFKDKTKVLYFGVLPLDPIEKVCTCNKNYLELVGVKDNFHSILKYWIVINELSNFFLEKILVVIK